MIVIIKNHRGGFSYCLSPISHTLDVHIYIQRIINDNIMFVDFNVSAEEIGQILGGN